MISLKTMMVGCVLAGACGMAAATSESQRFDGLHAWQVKPAQVCSAVSVTKHYTLADVDFAWARERLNLTLDRVPLDVSGGLRKAAGHRIADRATQFGLRIDHARCDAVPGPLHGEQLRVSAGLAPKDCRDADCQDPLPGWTAPEGSTMALWTCEGNVFREVVYEKVNGTWQVKSVREERVVSCQVNKDPEEGRGPGKRGQ